MTRLQWQEKTYFSQILPWGAALNIALLLYPNCMPTGLFAAADLLRAVALRVHSARWKVQWAGVRRGAVPCAHGTTLHADTALCEESWDAILLPGFWADTPAQAFGGLPDQAELLQALRDLPPDVALWTWCTGVAIAAAAGRLDDKVATGTWWMAPMLTQAFPRVDWHWQHSVVRSSTLITASGVHGYLSILGQELATRISPEAWRDVQRLMVLPRPQATADVFGAVQTLFGTDPWLARLRRLVEQTPAAGATLETLARAMTCSPRTLARKVADRAGMPVGQYARLIKLHQAGEHLSLGTGSVAQVCGALGFSSESGFRRSFKYVTGMTPAEYVALYR